MHPHYYFNVSQVYKFVADNPLTDPSVLTSNVINTGVTQARGGCGETWFVRQFTPGLGATYVMFLRVNPNDHFFQFSPVGKSGEIFAPGTTVPSPRWSQCRLKQVERGIFDNQCRECEDPNGNVLLGTVDLPDDCNTCTCDDYGHLTCTQNTCSGQTGVILAIIVVAVVLGTGAGVARSIWRRRREAALGADMSADPMLDANDVHVSLVGQASASRSHRRRAAHRSGARAVLSGIGLPSVRTRAMHANDVPLHHLRDSHSSSMDDDDDDDYVGGGSGGGGGGGDDDDDDDDDLVHTV
jgi:hypothetical protein